MLEGCTERREREMKFQRRLQAWAASIIVQPHVKERITPAMLLGEKDRGIKTMSREQSVNAALDVAFKHYVRTDGR